MARWNFPRTIPKRYILSFLAFFGFFNAYILRSNLSIAIITMVKPTLHITSTNITVTKPVGSILERKEKKIFFLFFERLRSVIIGIAKLKVIFSRRSFIVIRSRRSQLAS